MRFIIKLSFCFALIISCQEEENITPKVVATITIDGIERKFMNFDGSANDNYFFIEDNDDNAVVFVLNILSSDSLRNIVESQSTPKRKAEKVIDLLQNIEPTFGRALYTVDKVNYNCFTCFHQFNIPSYSIIYMENLSDPVNKKIWTSSYLDQAEYVLKINNLQAIEEFNKFRGFNTFYIRGEIEFQCVLADDLGEVVQIRGKSDVLFFEFY